jgi:cardiolipin synthase A/B
MKKMRAAGHRNTGDYTTRNKVKLIRSGKPYFDLLQEMINKAKKVIYLQFYIFLEDETGTPVIEALKAASRRGVSVFLHIDGYASKDLPAQCIKNMNDAGVKVKFFEPLLRSKHFYFGRRLHHKVAVADGLHSLVGGINVTNRYNDMPGEPAWLDMAVYCEGEASLIVQNICIQLWGNKKTLPAAGENTESIEQFYEHITPPEKTDVRVRRNDWVKRKNGIWKSYMEMFSAAEKNITIMCSYFLPGSLFRRKIKEAVNKGVKVKVILAGISDIMLAKHAERYLYDWMLRNNIEIYEYKETVLHAKVAVYDNCWTTVGSYNVNGLSAHASLEMNMDIRNKSFAVIAEKELNDIIHRHCKQVTKETYPFSSHIIRRFWQWICYNVISKMLTMVTFYFRRE